MPKRIQMSRQRPWRAENPDAVIVARPTKWGNPVKIVPVRARGPFDLERDRVGFIGQNTDLEGARRSAVARYRDLLINHPTLLLPVTIDLIRSELAGRDLACWCPLDHPCHADVLLEVANTPAHLCPECVQGKHSNCVEQTLDDNDDWVPCGCPEHEGSS